MTQKQANSNPVNDSPRCKHHTRVGRCRMLAAPSGGAFCLKHSRLPQNRAAEDLSAHLLDPIQDFLSPLNINEFLTRLIILLAENKIATRRAAVMAYITNQLLRTLPAIEHELDPTGQKKLPQIIWDISSMNQRPNSQSASPSDSQSTSPSASRIEAPSNAGSQRTVSSDPPSSPRPASPARKPDFYSQYTPDGQPIL